MKIEIRYPYECPCGAKWLGQNSDRTNLYCTEGHNWNYRDGQWVQEDDKLDPFMRKVTRRTPNE